MLECAIEQAPTDGAYQPCRDERADDVDTDETARNAGDDGERTAERQVALYGIVDESLGEQRDRQGEAEQQKAERYQRRVRPAGRLWPQGLASPWGERGTPGRFELGTGRGHEDLTGEVLGNRFAAHPSTPDHGVHHDRMGRGDLLDHHEVVALPMRDVRRIEAFQTGERFHSVHGDVHASTAKQIRDLAKTQTIASGLDETSQIGGRHIVPVVSEQ